MGVVLYAILVALFVFVFRNKFKQFYRAYQIPGPWFVPLLGCVHLLSRLRPETVFLLVNEFRVIYKRSFRLWLGTNLWIFLHSPEETKQALNDPSLTRAGNFQHLKILLGNGLLISAGTKWRTTRKALTPAFNQSILDGFMDTICHHASVFVRTLNVDQSIEITNKLFLCILDIIGETSMGAQINSQLDPSSSYAHAFHDTAHLLYQRMVNPILGTDFVYKRTKAWTQLEKAIGIIHRLTDKLILERSSFQNEKDVPENTVDEFGIKRKRAFLDILLNTTIDGKNITRQEIKDEVNTFLFAGVDTTTASMSFLLLSFGQQREMQRKAYEEIKSVVGDDASSLTCAQINELVYLDMFIKESMRFYTTVPLTGRESTKQIKIGDMIVEKDTTLWINMYGLAHDPEYFPNPEEFIPERFQPGHEQGKETFAYLPFSGGLHVCIGKRYSILIMKVLAIQILLQYEILLARPDEELELISEMVLKSKNGINLIFQDRK